MDEETRAWIDEQTKGAPEIAASPGTSDTIPISDLTSLADALVAQKVAKAEAKKAEEDANREIDRIEQAMNTIMVAHDLQGFKHEGKQFYPYVESHPRIADTDGFFSWCQDNGEEGIWKYTVHFQTLRAWYKEKGEQYAEALSEGKFIEVFQKIRIGVRKA